MTKALNTTNVDEKLEKMLRTDPLKEAEETTGKSCKEDKATGQLGFALHLMHSDSKRAALLSVGDSYYGITTEEYLIITAKEGFETVLEVPFQSPSSNQEEKLYIMWHPDGILLSFDTYRSNLNGGKFYYNLKLNDEKDYGKVISSGCCTEENVIYGSHDCREAFRHKLNKLRKYGSFLSCWEEQPFLWLCHHGDTKHDLKYPESSELYDKINKERMSMLPECVQKAIGFEE
jgi:hypothetical protein